jgi:iron complex outermembrane receptor protein
LVDTTDLIRRRWLNNDFYGITFSGQYKPSSKLELTLGGALNTYDGDHFGEIIWAEVAGDAKIRDRYYDNNGLKNDFNLYLKGSYLISSSLSLYGDIQYRTVDYRIKGINSDRQPLNENHNYNFFNPKVGLNYQLANNSSVYASYSIGNKEPLRVDFIDSPDGNTPTHETLGDLEIGYKRQSKSLNLNANFYYMNYSNQLVLTGELNDVGASLRKNVPSSYRTGVEIDLSYRYNEKWALSANATFSKNIINNYTEVIYDYGQNWDEFNTISIDYGNTNISFSPEITSGATLQYQPIQGMSFNWAHRYVGDQFLDNTSNEERKIGGYYLSDLRASYSFSALKLKAITFNIAVYNIFDNYYESNGYSYGYRGGGEEIRENFFYPQAGTNFMIGLNLKL